MTTTDPATSEPEPTPEPTSEPTTTETLERGAEVHARIGMALVSVSDAAELAAEPGALPDLIARSVLRSLSQAHRHLADADVMTSGQAVASARVVELAAADVARRIICSCGQAFTPAGFEIHRTAAGTDTHVVSGQLVAAGPSTRRRAVDVLVAEEEERREEKRKP